MPFLCQWLQISLALIYPLSCYLSTWGLFMARMGFFLPFATPQSKTQHPVFSQRVPISTKSTAIGWPRSQASRLSFPPTHIQSISNILNAISHTSLLSVPRATTAAPSSARISHCLPTWRKEAVERSKDLRSTSETLILNLVKSWPWQLRAPFPENHTPGYALQVLCSGPASQRSPV